MPNLFDYFVQRRQMGGRDMAFRSGRDDMPYQEGGYQPLSPQNEPGSDPRMRTRTNPAINMGLVANKPEQTAVRDIPALLSDPMTDPNNPNTGEHTLPEGQVNLGANQRQQVLPSELELERQKYDELSDRSTVKNNDKGAWGLIGDMLRQFIISGGEVARGGGSTGQILGGGIGGAGYAAYDPAVDEKRKREYDIGQQKEKLGELERRAAQEREAQDRILALEDRSLNRDYKSKQIENIDRDNDRLEGQAQETARQKVLDRIYKTMKYFDPDNVSPAMQAELDKHGIKPEDIGAFDLRKPETKIINGITFQYDYNQKAFIETGLPADAEKSLVDYTDADGQKWRVSARTGLQHKEALRRAKIMADAQMARQNDQQEFTAGENARTQAHQIRLAEIRGKIRSEQIILSGRISAEQRAASTKKIADWMDEAENLN